MLSHTRERFAETCGRWAPLVCCYLKRKMPVCSKKYVCLLSSIFEFVKEAQDNYRSQIVQVADGYDFSQ
jgi:hypothetical protein